MIFVIKGVILDNILFCGLAWKQQLFYAEVLLGISEEFYLQVGWRRSGEKESGEKGTKADFNLQPA